MIFGGCDGSIRVQIAKAIFSLRPKTRLTPNRGTGIRFVTKSQRQMVIGIRTIQNCGREALTSSNS
jgi:hypothetical protein